ncbi:hypothetical protein CON65_15580 [Bacillus pseudomycoides]|uniref:Uncharacterized protein n=1 Tax=Bacillus pseudomycoides TaxID=64104 RepID=A0AA91VCM8_9BACI|nr:hypothetical protein COO03_16675 [Bacillus sp. AFS098217]PED81740.1 hypothetical protein CON65_15580 [Bacillus pseudomycoides]PEU14510.1 hypothetical protein CN525_18205 [Bacillus sp. AFS014408]PEU15185.1 hypothetical protein CN524_07385 [Bacillus sp. AFS019443]PFW59228.1 hypothetical protein COL20_24535 [Bacillus sp. AFS075034]
MIVQFFYLFRFQHDYRVFKRTSYVKERTLIYQIPTKFALDRGLFFCSYIFRRPLYEKNIVGWETRRNEPNVFST